MVPERTQSIADSDIESMFLSFCGERGMNRESAEVRGFAGPRKLCADQLQSR